MKERPILFQGPMVRALLAGTKTQTRRAVKPQPDHPRFKGMLSLDDEGIDLYLHDRTLARAVRCPYGKPGDRLWVREAICQHNNYGFPLGPSVTATMFTGTGERVWSYAADGVAGSTRIRPSIHMPRWASRITLEITGVRVERLQEISEADAMAEGVRLNHGAWTADGDNLAGNPISAYRALWDHINRPGSWDANPWGWVVEFRRLKT